MLWMLNYGFALPGPAFQHLDTAKQLKQWEHLWFTVCTSHRMLQRGGKSKVGRTNNLLWLLMITLVLKTRFNTSSWGQGRAGYSTESVQQDQEWHPKSIEAFQRYMYQSIRKDTRCCRILAIFPDWTLQLLGNREILGEGLVVWDTAFRKSQQDEMWWWRMLRYQYGQSGINLPHNVFESDT